MTARRRRSCLTVPADDERKLAKAAGIEVDEAILDLEDAVAPERKDGARETLARALRDHTWRAATVAVRVNRGSAGNCGPTSSCCRRSSRRTSWRGCRCRQRL